MLPTRSLKRIRWEKIGMCIFSWKTKNKLTLPSEPKTVLVDFLHFQTIIIVACQCCSVCGTIREVNWHPSSYIFMEADMHPTPFFLLIKQKISLNAMVYFQNTFFWKTYVLLLFKFNQQAILSVACTYTEIFNNLFFRFFRNLCNILHECDSSATPEKPGTKINEGIAIILYLVHQNHGLGKFFCMFYISKHYLWWVSNLIFFFFGLFVSTSES